MCVCVCVCVCVSIYSVSSVNINIYLGSTMYQVRFSDEDPSLFSIYRIYSINSREKIKYFSNGPRIVIIIIILFLEIVLEKINNTCGTPQII